jgi:arginyl-tRNA synthetase
MVIAAQVAERLKENAAFAAVSAAVPGFINLTLSDDKITAYINGMISGENAGIPKAERIETIIIDYGGPNIAKPLHVGHLRAAIIGEAFKRLMRLLGCNVIGDVHLGDWGLQIGLVIAEMSERFPEYTCFGGVYKEGDALPPVTADDLNEIYPYASKKSKADKQFSDKAHNYTFKLQQGDAGFTAFWKYIWQVSVYDLKKNYEKLNVHYDLWYGESDADKYISEVIAILEEKGLLVMDSGAKIVDISSDTDKAAIPPAIIIKSDGAVNYETTDIATLLQRQRDFAPDKVWYAVDKRQELHFVQVFRTAKKAGIIPESTELSHFAFGTMNGSDGKPYKTRDGGVMRLSDLIENATAAALDKMRESNYAVSDDLREAAQKIGIAAIKFGDMVNQMTKDYIFDLDKFLSFDGKTGTYILYTITRINSILKKAEETGGGLLIGGVYSEAERSLMLKVIQTGDIFLGGG